MDPTHDDGTVTNGAPGTNCLREQAAIAGGLFVFHLI